MPDLKHEDYATWLNILKEINTVYFINEKLAIYRKLTTSTSSNKWNTISWVWKILRQNEQFSVIKSSFYLMRFYSIQHLNMQRMNRRKRKSGTNNTDAISRNSTSRFTHVKIFCGFCEEHNLTCYFVEAVVSEQSAVKVLFHG